MVRDEKAASRTILMEKALANWCLALTAFFSLGPVGEEVLIFSRSGPGLGGARGMEVLTFKQVLPLGAA